MKKKPQRSLASLLPKTADASPRMTKATDDLLARTAGRRKQLYLAYSLAPPADALWHLATWQSFAEESLAESTREADKLEASRPHLFPCRSPLLPRCWCRWPMDGDAAQQHESLQAPYARQSLNERSHFIF